MTAKDLKNALLQEAVQGKLVPQIASEGNARDLLEEIRKEKLSHGLDFANAKSGKRKSKKETVLAGSNPCDIKEEEIPFDIPDNWCWCRLGEICNEIKRGKSPKYADKSNFLAFAQKCNVKTGGIDLGLALYLDENSITRYSETDNLVQGDIVINSTGGGTMGRVGLYKTQVPAGIKGVYPDSHVTVIRSIGNINQHYLYYVLKLNQPVLEKCGTGSTNQTELKPAVLAELIIPLPPLAEQKRIVDAIEKFMPLIEEYGKKETELKAFNEQIGTLTKKAILQEAVQGKLVPQNTDEGNAKDLLEEIKKEKAKLIKEGKIKKEKPLPEISEDEIPFDIPENWCWCRVGDLFSTMSGLGYKKDVLSEKSSKMIRVLRGGNILDTSYVFKEDDILISDKYVKSELFLRKNYLITPAVTSLEHIGKIGYIEKDYDDTVVGGFVLMLLPHFSDEVLSKYCLYLFGTRWFRDMCKEITHKSGQAFYNLSRDKLLNLVIPVPPLAEQKRIIVAIKKMLQLCEKLGE